MGILEVKNVSKRFGGLQALGDVNLSIAENSVHAIIGPNGAGKSTLLNCLVGKLIPDTGSVMFDGQWPVLGRKPFEINQMGISRVFQTPEIFGDLSVLENMMIPCFAKRDGAFTPNAFINMLKDREIVERAEVMLEEMKMAEHRHMHAAALSRGDKRRLEIGMCLSQEPRLLLLETSQQQAWRAPTPTTPLICSNRSRMSAISPSQSSNTTCMLCSLWPSGLRFWLRGRHWLKTRQKISKVTPRCAKPILVKPRMQPNPPVRQTAHMGFSKCQNQNGART